MTHVTDGAINWLNVINMAVCVICSLALWVTVLLQQNSKHPIPRFFQVGLLILAVTYALSVCGMLGAWAGISGAPGPDLANMSLAQLCWMTRNVTIAIFSVAGAVTTWRLSRPSAPSTYEFNHGYYVSKRSAAQIPVLQSSER